jgi:hypothetical protein
VIRRTQKERNQRRIPDSEGSEQDCLRYRRLLPSFWPCDFENHHREQGEMMALSRGEVCNVNANLGINPVMPTIAACIVHIYPDVRRPPASMNICLCSLNGFRDTNQHVSNHTFDMEWMNGRVVREFRQRTEMASLATVVKQANGLLKVRVGRTGRQSVPPLASSCLCDMTC